MRAVTTIRWKPLILSILIPLAVGALSGFLTMNSMEVYGNLVLPPLSPPGWLFPVVWGILFVLMGISSYLVYASGEPGIRSALTVYAVQLAVNFFWSIIFFHMQAYAFAFFWLLLLWVLVVVMIWRFGKINRTAAWLQVPYLLWLTFAGYLNLFVWLLN
ncbi:MAG: TspO/MBR family protein [Oscillospiraceae bacterium]|jgi:benzodiazapine receptor